LWFSRTDEGRSWSGLELQFSADERTLFFASTYMVVGDGQVANFWEDPVSRRSVCDIHGTLGIHEIGQYLRLWREIKRTALTNQTARLIWRFNAVRDV
jgi:hypothetical protein